MMNSPYEDEFPCEVCGIDPADCECPECPVCSEHGNPKCKINEYKHGGIIRKLSDLVSAIGLDIGSDESSISKALYKGTDNGIMFKELHNESESLNALYYSGVTVCGFAEGSQGECVPIELVYPFTPDAFWNAVTQADDEGSELWHECNDEEELA